MLAVYEWKKKTAQHETHGVSGVQGQARNNCTVRVGLLRLQHFI